VLREWGNDLGFTQLPKFTLWESLTPEPPPLSTISHLCAVIGFFQQSYLCFLLSLKRITSDGWFYANWFAQSN